MGYGVGNPEKVSSLSEKIDLRKFRVRGGYGALRSLTKNGNE